MQKKIETLYVDLDGTLVSTDTLHEGALQLLKSHPVDVLKLPVWLAQGKGALKREIADRAPLDVTRLPYREEVLALIQDWRARQQRVVLATAANMSTAQAVADHLGCFDAVLASTPEVNLAGPNKLAAILADAQRLDSAICYAGDARVDLSIWKNIPSAVVVNASPAFVQEVRAVCEVRHVVTPKTPGMKDYLYGIRMHQWAKNALIGLPLLPLLGAITPGMCLSALLAFLVFSLVASSVYILNDLMDLDADRIHARKKHRPFASGLIGVPAAIGMFLALLLGGVALAAMFLPWQFVGVLIAYIVITKLYSFRLKHRVLLDVFTLAGLYTIRIIAGAAAINAPLSLWILCFSLFIFLSLALAKRYTELGMLRAENEEEAWARGYSIKDKGFVLGMGLSSGQIAVLILCLYLNDPAVVHRYAHPMAMWLLAPLLLFWVSKTWLMAFRGQLHDDPVVFAMKDRVSRMVFAVMLLCVVAAVLK